MGAIEDLTAQVENTVKVEAAAIARIQADVSALATAVLNGQVDPAKVAELTANLKTSSDALSAVVTTPPGA